MDLMKLRHFVTVAELGNMTQAAAELGITQPALSQSISRLEKDLDLRLFIRSRRGTELTEGASLLLDDARAVIARADSVTNLARRVSSGNAGKIAVGFISAALYQVVPYALRRLKASMPHVQVELHEMKTNEQLAGLRRGEIDIGISHSPVPPEASLQARIIAQYALVAAVPAKSPLGRRNEVAIKDLAREGLILFPEGQGLPDRARILDAFRSHGVEPRIVQEASPALAVLSCVSAGVGMALLPECIGFIDYKGVRLCRIQRPNPFPTLVLSVIRRSHPRRKIVDRFWQHCLASN